MHDNGRFPGWDKIIPSLAKLPQPIASTLAYQVGAPSAISQKQNGSMPPMYHVWLLKDDYTPMEFVMLTLEKFFHKNKEISVTLAVQAHKEGQVICGLYTREVAESKVIQVIDFARAHEYPLKCVMRKEQPYAIKKS